MPFHSLKGLFLNIGADVLAEKSKHFEIAAKEGRMEEIGAGLEGYLREVLSFHKDLVSAYGQYCEGKKEAAQGKDSILRILSIWKSQKFLIK